jgi:16S rRNA (uracil1498-N3)-methyltransferase
MPSLPRFFAPDVTATGGDVALPLDEARHLRQVLRLSAGVEVIVFDGRGREFLARVVEAGRSGVSVRLLEERQPARQENVRVTLAVAALKANHLDDVVRDATMLGVETIQPLTTRRSTVPDAALRRSNVMDRWRRVAIASAKQSRRNTLPSIASPIDVEAFIARGTWETKLMFVEPVGGPVGGPAGGSDAIHTLFQAIGPRRPTDAAVLIGPEGGWTADEVRLASVSGFLLITLGEITLRADAVPVIALAALKTLWKDW